MITRSKKQQLVSPESEPQRRARLLQKASRLNPDPEMEEEDHSRIDHEVGQHNNHRRNLCEEDGLSDDEQYGREEYQAINLPPLAAGAMDWSIKSNIMANLPKFYGRVSENPHTHLKDLHNQCEAIKPTVVNRERAKLKAFPWSLEKAAKVWYDNLTPNSITTWQQMSSTFLKKFWSNSRAQNFEKDIVALKQKPGMSYPEYYLLWKQNQDLWQKTSLSRKQIIGYFTSGLTAEEQEKLRWTAGKDMGQMTNDEKMELLEKVYETRALQDGETTSSKDLGAFTAQLAKLTTSFDSMIKQNQSLQDQLKAKPVYAIQENDFSPVDQVCDVNDDTLISNNASVQNSDELIPVNAAFAQNIPVGPGFPYGGSQYQYRYQPGFKWNQQNQTGQAHNNNQGQSSNQNSNQAQWGRQGQNNQNNNRGGQANNNQGNWNNNNNNNNNNQSNNNFETFMAQTTVAMKAMQEQLRQMNSQGQQGKLPSSTENNPKTFHAVTLRSGLILPEREKEVVVMQQKKVDPNQKTGSTSYDLSINQFLPPTSNADPGQASTPSTSAPAKEKMKEKLTPEVQFPYPAAKPVQHKKAEDEAEILSMFSKIVVNIPMLTLLSKVPSYAKFIKDIYTNKQKFAEKTQSTATVSSLTSFQIPEKLQDKGTFTIPCVIGEKTIPRPFCDLGAGINMLSVSEYKSMEMGPLKPTSVTIQVADRNILYPKGVIEDVLVNVNGFYPVDFYVVDLSSYLPSCHTNVLLGRPFLRTAKAKIDCSEWSISLDFFGNTAKFNMIDAKGIPSNQYCVNFLDVLSPLTNRVDRFTSEESFAVDLNTPTGMTSQVQPINPQPLKPSIGGVDLSSAECEETVDKTKRTWSNDEERKERGESGLNVCSFLRGTTTKSQSIKFLQSSGTRSNQAETLQNRLVHHNRHFYRFHFSLAIDGSKKLSTVLISSPATMSSSNTVSSDNTSSSDNTPPTFQSHHLPPNLTPRAL